MPHARQRPLARGVLLVVAAACLVPACKKAEDSGKSAGPTTTSARPAGAAAGWRTYTSTAAGFSIEFPATPDETASTSKTERGNPFRLNSAIAHAPGGAVFSAVRMQGDPPQQTPEQVINSILAPVARQGIVVSSRDISLANHPGRELVLHSDLTHLATRVYYVDGAVYQTTVEYPPALEGQMAGPIERFLNSFKLLAK